MAVSGILSSSVFNLLTQLSGQSSSHTNPHNKFHQIKQDFQQLGSDLSSGNISQAQSDFSALQQLLPSSQQSSAASSATTTASAQTTSPLLTAINQLGQDLQSGNLPRCASGLRHCSARRPAGQPAARCRRRSLSSSPPLFQLGFQFQPAERYFHSLQ